MKLSTNEVTLIGFVGGDAQAKVTKNHNKYAVVSLATTESWKDKNGDWQKRSTWHRLVVIWKIEPLFKPVFLFEASSPIL